MRSWRSTRLHVGFWGLLAVAHLSVWGCGRERINPIDPSFPGNEALSPPTNVRAEGGIGRIILAWNAVNSTQLAGYGVWRSTSSTGTYEQLRGEADDPSTTTGQITFVDTTLDLKTTKIYFYKVTTIDTQKRASEFSVFVSAEALEDTRPPSAPSDLSAVTDVETGHVTLTWTVPQTDANNQELTGLNAYQVFRSKDSQDAFVLVGSAPAGQNAFVDSTDLEIDAQYFYRVSALDGEGNESGRSVPASITTTGSGVAVPVGLQATGTIGQIEVRWDPVTEPNLIGYLVLRSTDTQEAFQAVTSDTLFTTAQTEYTDTDIEPDRVYFYRVQSVIQDPERGTVRSVESVFVDGKASIDQSPPAAPSDLIVSLDESDVRAVQLNWSAPLKDSNSGDLTGLEIYRIFRSEGNNVSFAPLADVPSTQTSYQDRDTKLLTQYFYAVSAVDADDNVSPRSNSVPVTTGGLAVPQGLSATAGIGQVGLAWTANTETDLIGYKVLRSDRSIGPFAFLTGDESEAFTTAQTAYVDSPLVADETFFYRLIAVGRNDVESDTSTFVTATVLRDEQPPGAPLDVVAAVDETNLLQVNLSWTPPTTDSNGGDLTGLATFRIFRSEGSASSFVQLVEVPGSQSAYQDTAVAAATQYFYQISGVDASDNVGPRSAVVSITTRGMAAPRNVTATEDINQVVLSWAANTESELTGYRVLRYTDPQAQAQAVFSTVQTTYVDSPLAAGQTFVYRVQAVGTGGLESELSQFVSAEVPLDNRAPATPGVFSGSLSASDAIELTWSAPKTDAGGSELTGFTGFRIYRSEGTGGPGFGLLTQADSTRRVYDDQGLELATTYSYRISAIDGHGNESALSSSISLTTSTASPPTNVQAAVITTVTDTLVRVTWTEPAEFTSFRVERQTVGTSSGSAFSTVELSQTESTFDDTNVESGRSYLYRVLTNLKGVLSEPSEAVGVSVPAIE